MTQQSESGGAARAPADTPPPSFDRLIRTHTDAAASYRQLAWLLVILGVAIVAMAALAGSVPLAGPGLVVAMSAFVCWKKSSEHAERAAGIEVLKEEWAETAHERALEGLRSILLDLYGTGDEAPDAKAKPA
ncbi:MAG TPA: hypothetical protein PKA09_14520 [Geminicoccus sp.]|nr:hypothetical protein [Geminicoccus sp.]